jgi:oligopeptidase A
VTHLFGVRNSPELREAYETVLPEMVAFGLKVRQSKPVYEALRTLREGEDWNGLDEGQRRIVERRLLDARLAGIGLPDDERRRFNEIAEELSQLGTTFSNNVLDANKAFSLVLTEPEDVAGLPPSLLRLGASSFNSHKPAEAAEATPEGGPWRFTLDSPSYGPFMEHSRRRELRERMYRAFITRASAAPTDNAPILRQILALRLEQARLLGFESFAEMSLATKMAQGVDAVLEMLERLRAAAWPHAEREMADLCEIAGRHDVQEPLMHWDVAYWAERLREERFQFTDEELRPYFAFERVLEGLFALCHRLFGIKVEAADGEAPVWNPDVRFFHIRDEAGTRIASFYLDPYSRPENKRGGAWMDDCFGRRVTRESVRNPVAHLVCNQTPPSGGKPSLMSFREVETLFHEFGHGLQHMLTRVDYADAAGINNVEWDAVELPSQFLENWCYHRPTLLGLTAHYETGAPLPEELFEKIVAARTFRSGSQMLRQLQFGLTDLRLHTDYDPAGEESPFEVMREVNELTSVMPMLPENRFLCSFQHIFSGGYAAGYYSYKWAEVLAADAFSAFEEAGLEDASAVQAVGRRFRDTVLSLGGSKHPLDVFREFRGRDPSPEPLLRVHGLA